MPGPRLRDPERYQLIGEHGRGGLGRVSRVHDRDLGRDVAIKELISRAPISELRFLREALITARLEHPGIVPVHEAGRWPDGTPFYAMKLVAGRPLRELLAERVTVEERIGLLHHVIAVADAIAYAHRCHIIHRDLKPANVIVGDFGETVVIDWGLAKDLSATEDAVTGDGSPGGRHDGLTTTGLVLGTPAYMAPEQARGEHVDQRADVFALGAMLWELCTLEKLQPADRAQRSRLLRRSGVDRDLVAIIEKSIDPEPARRYPDAGALAADLKAFKAGARIAARSYSLFAMLGHRARRHRALAVSIGAAAIVAVSGTALYVRSVAIERDRAEASNNRLLLQQSELLLHSDPSAAFDLLGTYRGDDAQQLHMLQAKARSLGVARVRAQPHTQVIYFAHALADGTVLTLAADGTVAKTAPDGRSRVIARGVTPQYTVAYSASRHLLAYACNATGLCLLDTEAEAPRPAPAEQSPLAPTCLQFSPDAQLLAALSPRGELAVWQLGGEHGPTRVYSEKFEDGEAIRFVDGDTMTVETEEDMHIVHLPRPGRPAPPAGLELAGIDHVTTSTTSHLVAGATAGGSLVVLDGETQRELLTGTICRGPVNRLLVLAGPPAVAYACQDGDTGVMDLQRRAPRVLTHLDGGATSLAATGDGRLLIVGGARGQLAIYDAATQIVHARLGHATRISVVLPPSAEFPYIVSGDESGALRVWSPPEPTVRVVARTATRMLAAVPLAGQGPVIAVGFDTAIPWYGRDGSAGALDGHVVPHVQLAVSSTQPRFALYGADDDIELWSLEAGAIRRTLRSQHGAVTGVAFGVADERVRVGHRDGTIAEWPRPDAAPRDLGTIHDTVDLMATCPRSDIGVIAGAGGALWLVHGAELVPLAPPGEPITALACARDGRQLVVGTAGGNVRLYDVTTRQPLATFSAASWIEFIEFSADSRSIAISSNGRLRVVAIDGGRDLLALPARHAAFSPDGAWFVAIGDQGDVWFHRAADDRWVYLATGVAKVSPAAFSDDSRYFVATDPGGRALLVDLSSAAFR
jgi:WD40 repeat protein